MSEPFEPELGQAIFSNAPWNEHEGEDHVREGIGLLGTLLADGGHGDPTTNHGPDGNFSCDVFAIRAYCWCEGEYPGHEHGCPPNFEAGDFMVRWYKHSKRGLSQNRAMPFSEWVDLMCACLQAVKTARQP